MASYNGTTVDDLDKTKPAATDDISEGDDAMREIKTVMKNNGARVAKTGAYTIQDSDSIIEADASGGDFTLTLPAVASVSSATHFKKYTIINVGASGTVTIDGNGSETINGSETLTLATQYATLEIFGNGTAWYAIARVIETDTIAEASSGNGIEIDGFKIKDNAPDPTSWPSFSVDAAQSGISSATWTKATWSNEDFDTNSDFASNKFTPTVAGKYQLNAGVALNNTAAAIGVAIYKNGSPYRKNVVGSTELDVNHAVISCVASANGSTDYFEVYIYHNGGNGNFTDAVGNFFDGCRIG